MWDVQNGTRNLDFEYSLENNGNQSISKKREPKHPFPLTSQLWSFIIADQSQHP